MAVTRQAGISAPTRMVRLIFVAVVSATILAYELLLTRILSIQYWSYFAAMVISLAMLGFAASGTALFVASRKGKGTVRHLPWMTILFIVSLPIGPRLAQMIDCMPLMVLWDRTQLLNFGGYYLLLCLPFFFGGFIIGHYFLAARLAPRHVYFANMLGSGAGVLLALLLLVDIHPGYALSMAVVPLAVTAWPVFKSGSYRLVLIAATLLAGGSALLVGGLPRISQYKGMSALMLMPDAEIEYADWSPFGYLTVMDSKTIRYAPGLSLAYAGTIPEQKAVFFNGGSREVVCVGKTPAALNSFFRHMISGAAYLFHEHPRVLVIGAGGGMPVLAAVVRHAEHVDALENNRALAELMTGPLADFSGKLYERENVNLIIDSARPYSNRTTNHYDLVIIPAKGALFASAAGTSAQDPDYLLTREALADFFSVLGEDGLLAMETWLNLPARHSAKLFATAAQMLKHQGLDPANHLVAIRSLRTSLLMVSKTAFTKTQIARVKEFCTQKSFDRIYHPGLQSEEANLFNRVQGAPYYNLYAEIIGNRQSAYNSHLLRIRPATDDTPYFSHFFKWAALPQIISKSGRNAPGHIGWGYVFLLITLAQAIPLGIILILLPVAIAGNMRKSAYGQRLRICSYFAALGAAFMLLEITAIQQFVRFLPHPVYAFGITVGLFLFFSGLGAFASTHRLVTNRRLFALIIIFAFLHIAVWLFAVYLRSRWLFLGDVAIVAILAFFMGMPFPRGIDSLRVCAPDWIPWAWGINGFVSVVAALTSGLAALSWGLSASALAGVVCYAAAALTFPSAGNRP